ncbi:MAG: hypothetical protein IT353_18645 [Gemmatimonadaceae bacterium]|nr:hypothetical protein [Gemmatimonadaceae bacterium]
MIICVDGTGVYDGAQYKKDMENSFCNQICAAKGFGKAFYFEGPGGLGLTTRGTGNRALNLIKEYYQNPVIIRESPLYLAGYSRGAACVLQVAKWLQEDYPAMRVKGLFLFDPVNRDLNLNMDGLGTPSNVKTVYIILRDPGVEWVDFPNDPDRYGRRWMGTCAWTPQDKAATKVGLHEVIQHASHGAAGGCAWRERPMDRIGEGSAAFAMNKALKAEQLHVALEAKTFPPMDLPKSNTKIKITFKR